MTAQSVSMLYDVNGRVIPQWYDTAAGVFRAISDTTPLPMGTSTSGGTHVYGYSGGNLITDAWTLNGITRTKTFTYNGDNTLATVSDWV